MVLHSTALIGALVYGALLFRALVFPLQFLAKFKSCVRFVRLHTSSKVKAVF